MDLMDNGRFFSINLRRLREERRWSQETLAEKAGVSKHTIFRAESKNIIPRGGNILKIANALGVNQSILFEDPSSPDSLSSKNPPKTAAELSPDEFADAVAERLKTSDQNSDSQNLKDEFDKLKVFLENLNLTQTKIEAIKKIDALNMPEIWEHLILEAEMDNGSSLTIPTAMIFGLTAPEFPHDHPGYQKLIHGSGMLAAEPKNHSQKKKAGKGA